MKWGIVNRKTLWEKFFMNFQEKALEVKKIDRTDLID